MCPLVCPRCARHRRIPAARTTTPKARASVARYGTAGAQRRSGVGVCSGSQIGTRYHHPEPSSSGRYSVEQPHQSGMRSVSGGVHPVRPRSLARQAHRGDLATARPTRAGGAGAASGVEPDGRRHWMISSARSRSDGGIVSRSSWAVLTLMTRSNRTGCSTGSSPGLAPFRILYTKVAARRHSSGRFGP
jgi:hypothetical protein